MEGREVLLLGWENFGAIPRIAPVIRRLEYSPVAVVNAGCNYDYSDVCDRVINVSRIFDPDRAREEILQNAPQQSVFGIVNQLDLLSFTFAKVADAYPNSRHVPIEPLLRCRLKAAMRLCFKDDPALQIKFDVLDCPDGQLSRPPSIPFPCIVKPIGGAGSQMVRKCLSEAHLRQLIPQLQDHLLHTMPGLENADLEFERTPYSPTRQILLEEVLSGPEMTVDGFVHRGKTHVVLIQDIFETSEEEDFLDISFISPPIRVDSTGVELVKQRVARALSKVGYDNAYFHVEMKFTPEGPRVVEINPRLAGGHTPQIFQFASGIDAADVFTRLSLHEELPSSILDLASRDWTSRPYLGCFTFFAPRPGLVAEIHGLTEATTQPGYLYHLLAVPKGKRVSSIIGKRYLALFVFQASTPQELVARLHGVRDTVRFDIT